jgi:hypothetical protein
MFCRIGYFPWLFCHRQTDRKNPSRMGVPAGAKSGTEFGSAGSWSSQTLTLEIIASGSWRYDFGASGNLET